MQRAERNIKKTASNFNTSPNADSRSPVKLDQLLDDALTTTSSKSITPREGESDKDNKRSSFTGNKIDDLSSEDISERFDGNSTGSDQDEREDSHDDRVDPHDAIVELQNDSVDSSEDSSEKPNEDSIVSYRNDSTESNGDVDSNGEILSVEKKYGKIKSVRKLINKPYPRRNRHKTAQTGGKCYEDDDSESEKYDGSDSTDCSESDKGHVKNSSNNLSALLDNAIVNEPKKSLGKKTSRRKGKEKKKPSIDQDIFNIFIYCLENSESYPGLISHPAVEVYICSTSTGELFRKSAKNRRVTSAYENTKIPYILPVMTHVYDMKKNRSLFCQWNEELLFNEPFKYLTENNNDAIIFFNLKDFSTSSDSIKSNSQYKGWRTFAWAFLKVISITGNLNVNKVLKLQLYRPRKYWNVKSKDVYSWWKSGSRRSYNSCLKVSVNKVPLSKANNFFENKSTNGNLKDSDSILEDQSNADMRQNQSVRFRRTTEPCTIPHVKKYSLSTFEEGCMVVKYSNNGFMLAAASPKYLLVFDLEGQILHSLAGHLNIVYDLDWSKNDEYTVSCSSDCTAIVWKIGKSEAFISDVLHHPSFVYSARFLPSTSQVLFTGCYDNSIRQWRCQNNKWEMQEEYNQHLGYVSALCFSVDHTFLFSGDHQGVIGLWTVDGSKSLSFVRKVKMNEIFGKNINHLAVHPKGRRLLVHTRDSQIRLVNYETWMVTENLCGFHNDKLQMRSCMSPCGTWVLSGCEKSKIFVWSTETGIIENILESLPFRGIISCVDYHPYEDMMAACSAIRGSRILVITGSDKIRSDGPQQIDQPRQIPNNGITPPTHNNNIKYDQKHIIDEGSKVNNWRPVKSDLLKKLDIIIQFAVDGGSKKDRKEKLELSSMRSKVAARIIGKQGKRRKPDDTHLATKSSHAEAPYYSNTSFIYDDEMETSPSSTVFD